MLQTLLDSSFAHEFTFLLGVYLGVESLGHRASVRSALVDTAKQFSEVVVPTGTFRAALKSLD